MPKKPSKENNDSDPPICDEHHHSTAAGTSFPLELEDSQRMAEFFGVLADPTRLRLISLLPLPRVACATWQRISQCLSQPFPINFEPSETPASFDTERVVARCSTGSMIITSSTYTRRFGNIS